MSVQPLSETIKQTPIANSLSGKNKIKPIANSTIVDRLLADYQDLIAPEYKKWFAARFYYLPFDSIHRAASEARHDGKNPQRLFAYLIKKIAGQNINPGAEHTLDGQENVSPGVVPVYQKNGA